MNINFDIRLGSNLCVVSGYTDNWREVGELTSRTNSLYCLKQRYDYRVYTGEFDKLRHPSWSKLSFVRDALKDHDWVFWIDADAIFTNHKMKIMDLVKLGGDFFICREEHNVINFGIWLVRRCDWSFWLFDRMSYTDMNKWKWGGNWEQSAFNELAYNNELGNQVVHYPMRTFNSVMPPYGRESMLWQPGDFIAHRMGGTPARERIEDIYNCMKLCGLEALI